MSRPHNGQQEPPYTDEHTVTCSLAYPEMVCHLPSARCAIQEPHTFLECGEWGEDNRLALVLA